MSDELGKAYRATRYQILRPPPKMNLPEWADTYRRLPATAAIAGRWRTSSREIARGPMMAMTEPGVQMISAKTCTQLMKTEFLLNVIGYFAHLDPAPMLLVLPKDDAVKQFSKERLGPMARDTPILHELLRDRERGGIDTLGYKAFPGGFLAIVSAGSPTNLAMRPIRILVMDEIDKFEITKEGDPVLLARERTASFMKNALVIQTCSPTWEEDSRINKAYYEGDQRRAFVKCPHCQYEQVLEFSKRSIGGYVEWSKSEEGDHYPATAAVYCEDCGAEWSEAQRIRIMQTEGAIRWFQTRPFVCCDVRQEPLKTRKWRWDEKVQCGYALCEKCNKETVSNEHASFTASKLYAPDITMPQLAAKFLASKGDPQEEQTFQNTNLGLAYHAQALRRVDAYGLAARREQFMNTVPRGVLLLTAGFDVQPGSAINEGRIEVEVVGWGVGEESWSVAYHVFHGNPAQPEIWNQIDQFLLQGFPHELGPAMFIHAACIDSGGHNTEEVYKFCRARVGRNVWAIKGSADRSGQWSPVWPIAKFDPKKSRVTGYHPIMLGVNAAKEAIRQRLLIEEAGPGYCHFPTDRPEAWFDQLTAETLILEKKNGFNIKKWVLPRGRANEALDCRVYAYGALCGWYSRRGGNNLNRLATVIEQPLAVEPAKEPAKPDVTRPAEPPRRSQNHARRGWLAEGD